MVTSNWLMADHLCHHSLVRHGGGRCLTSSLRRKEVITRASQAAAYYISSVRHIQRPQHLIYGTEHPAVPAHG